jgi:hypothetical protein
MRSKQGSETLHVCGWRQPEANSYIVSSAGNEGGTVLPQAKKSRWNAVARAAAFGRRPEQGSETL